MTSVTRFVGLDYHKDGVQVCVLDSEGRRMANRSVDNLWTEIEKVVIRGLIPRQCRKIRPRGTALRRIRFPGLHQDSLGLVWFTPGYLRSLLRSWDCRMATFLFIVPNATRRNPQSDRTTPTDSTSGADRSSTDTRERGRFSGSGLWRQLK